MELASHHDSKRIISLMFQPSSNKHLVGKESHSQEFLDLETGILDLETGILDLETGILDL